MPFITDPLEAVNKVIDSMGKKLVCPYCGDEKDSEDRYGCCGESSAHYVEEDMDDKEEQYAADAEAEKQMEKNPTSHFIHLSILDLEQIKSGMMDHGLDGWDYCVKLIAMLEAQDG